jgi:hypothetical protein
LYIVVKYYKDDFTQNPSRMPQQVHHGDQQLHCKKHAQKSQEMPFFSNGSNGSVTGQYL